jgi:membrane dipeptidase
VAAGALPIFDGHNDALTRPGYRPLSERLDEGHLDLPRMREGGMRGGIFALFSPSPDSERGRAPASHPTPVGRPEAAAYATAAAGRLVALQRAGELRIARGPGDLDTALAAPDAASGSPAAKPVAVMHLEGAEAIDPELEALEHWYAAGLRSLGPVWSRPNAFGHGVPFLFPGSPDTGPGLTPAGVVLVRRCAELGVMVDLSHLNEAGFWDVARLEVGPLVASHAGAHALAPATRNLTDGQLDEIGRTGGLVGIVFAAPFLRPDFAEDPATPLRAIVDHVRHAAERIGAEHVALGSDFDGATIPSELGDVSGLPRLVEALRGAGFERRELEAICWSNWRRVLAAWWRE